MTDERDKRNETDEVEPDPRFTFANERTFLAWIRTALALLAAGLAATQVLPPFELEGARHVIGLPLIGLGILSAGLAHDRWARGERALRLGRPVPPSPLARILPYSVAAVGVVAGVVVVIG